MATAARPALEHGAAMVGLHQHDWMWAIDIALAVRAALIHLPIRDAQPRGRGPLSA